MGSEELPVIDNMICGVSPGQPTWNGTAVSTPSSIDGLIGDARNARREIRCNGVTAKLRLTVESSALPSSTVTVMVARPLTPAAGAKSKCRCYLG